MHRKIVVTAMKERRLRATTGAAWILVIAAVFHAPLLWPTQAQHDYFTYCYLRAGTTVYFSGVYLAPYTNTREYDFHNFLKDQYQVGYSTYTTCDRRNPREEAEAALKLAIREANEEKVTGPGEAILTHWTPDGTSNSNSRPQPIEDFHVTVPPTDQTVRVCVRDHECEDGDRVRVSVNTSVVLSGEIVNEWACKSVPVTEGRNSIELFAVNGTGRKGACSHADVNTGEIRVDAAHQETQTWRHRGGAGSSANIVVTVR